MHENLKIFHNYIKTGNTQPNDSKSYYDLMHDGKVGVSVDKKFKMTHSVMLISLSLYIVQYFTNLLLTLMSTIMVFNVKISPQFWENWENSLYRSYEMKNHQAHTRKISTISHYFSFGFLTFFFVLELRHSYFCETTHCN